ncbi:MAG: SpoIIE family protein phosphatase [Gammaproteobacteria bacterium]
MNEVPTTKISQQEAIERVLEVTRMLAAPFDLDAMLGAIIDAAERVLDADAARLWMYDPERDDLVLQLAGPSNVIRLPAGHGLVGGCARTRKAVNIHDCYADPRFQRIADKKLGYRTRNMLAVPMIGYQSSLVGVLQVLNRHEGSFDESDERIGATLAAQGAVAVQRVQMVEQLVASEKLDKEVTVAREIQMGTLPKVMPSTPGYDIYGLFRPTEQTGGDTFDFVPITDDRLLLLMGDATGHGFGPALSATQVRSMLRVAVRMGASLDTAFFHLNNQLCEDLPEDRFVTAFLGELDAKQHTVQFYSAGQGPILHFHAANGEFAWYEPTTYPLGIQVHRGMKESQSLQLEPGDVLGLISDGIYEYVNASRDHFGEKRVAAVVREHHNKPMSELSTILLEAARGFGGAEPQADDVTIVFLRRLPG